MKTTTKNVKIRPLCLDILVLVVRRENFIELEGVNYDVKTAFMNLNQGLAV